MLHNAVKGRSTLSKIIFDDFADNGKMSAAQFRRVCRQKLDYTDVDNVDLDAAFVKINTSGIGFIRYDEFLEWWKLQDNRHVDALLSPEERRSVRDAQSSFQAETGGASTMTKEQFKLQCYNAGYCLSDQELSKAFKELDSQGRGAIEFSDYLRWWRKDKRFGHLSQRPRMSVKLDVGQTADMRPRFESVRDNEDGASDSDSEEDTSLDETGIHQVASYFRKYDSGLTGFLSVEQFNPLYENLLEVDAVSAPLEDVLRQIGGKAGAHCVSLNDFTKWYMQRRKSPEQMRAELQPRTISEKQRVVDRRASFKQSTGGADAMAPEQFRVKCYAAGYCLSDEELEAAMKKLDPEGLGFIDFATYVGWWQSEDRFAHLQHEESEGYSATVREVGEYFRKYDTELTGRLSAEQFRPLYQNLCDVDAVGMPLESLMQEIGNGGDTRSVRLNNFLRWYMQRRRSPDQVRAELEPRSRSKQKSVVDRRASFMCSTAGETTMTPDQFRLKCYIAGYCLTDEELEEAMAKLDPQGNGSIVFSAYVGWWETEDRFSHLQHKEDEFAEYARGVGEYFRQYDTELKGYLSLDEFKVLHDVLLESSLVSMPYERVLRDLKLEAGKRLMLNDFMKWYMYDLQDVATEAA